MSGMRFFGPKWDAPITDDAKVMATPTDRKCDYCGEQFVEGDAGTVNLSNMAVHKECGLRSALGGIGHLVSHNTYCNSDLGPDAGFTPRESAILVWSWQVDGLRLNVDQLNWLRRRKREA